MRNRQSELDDYPTTHYKASWIRTLDQCIVGIVQVEQLPYQYLSTLDCIHGLDSLILGLCDSSIYILAGRGQLSSQAWCLRVLRKLWESDQGVNGVIPSSEKTRTNSRLQEDLYDLVRNWTRTFIRETKPEPQMCPVAFWRTDEWPWMAFYGVPEEWINLHQQPDHQ
ncbi:hypothetical protein F4804DRAFT_28752 [Jackrogersella minutella]|nr:hypothetical protein F4804DRAFT_28752 [Jackrogersella minutella]